jgi:ribosomal protein L11 methylase PrmA
MKPGGILVASGVLEERGDEVKEAFVAARLTEVEIQHSEDWLALVYQRQA